MKGQRKVTINRVQYKEIKKKDHKQMEDYIQSLYMSGYEDGRESVPGVELNDIMEAIKETKGIGEVKLAAIRENVDRLYKRQQDQA